MDRPYCPEGPCRQCHTVALDSGNLAVFYTLLDLSAAFDSVDHSTLLHRLQSYGLGGAVIDWFTSYLSGCTQQVRSRTIHLITIGSYMYGVPRGSVLGPILFLLYAVDLLQLNELIRRHQLSPHAYADDTQIYGFCRPNDIDDLSFSCLSASTKCRRGKAPIGCSSTPPRLKSFGALSVVVSIRSATAQSESAPLPFCRLTRSFRDGVYLDADATMTTHVKATVRSCFAALQ